MTTMLDLISALSTPIQRAESAVKEDDVEKLRKLLTSQPADASQQLVTEDCLVNPQVSENLLHFAVHQVAAKCVALLANPPFCWDPDRPNLIGRTATQLAETKGYLPVWYPLAIRSRQSATAAPGSGMASFRSVAAFLIYPHEFLIKPFEWTKEIITNGHTGCAISLSNQYDNTDAGLSAANLALFFELIRATPIALGLSSAETVVSGYPAYTDTHPLDCLCFPKCLLELMNTDGFRSLTPDDQFRRLFELWMFHRMRTELETNTSTATGEEKVDQTADAPVLKAVLSPIPLLDMCRMHVRRLVTAKLKYCSNLPDSGDQIHNYPSLITKLPLPPRLHAFMAFRDLWPAWDRHMVPKYSRSRSHPGQTWFGPFDPWFPVEPMPL